MNNIEIHVDGERVYTEEGRIRGYQIQKLGAAFIFRATYTDLPFDGPCPDCDGTPCNDPDPIHDPADKWDNEVADTNACGCLPNGATCWYCIKGRHSEHGDLIAGHCPRVEDVVDAIVHNEDCEDGECTCGTTCPGGVPCSDLLASDPQPIDVQAQHFFAREGDYYLVTVDLPRGDDVWSAFQFAIKATEDQLPYVREIFTQLRGASGGRVVITKAIVDPNQMTTGTLDRVYEGPFEDEDWWDLVPGSTPAYAKRPPQPGPEYVGKHRGDHIPAGLNGHIGNPGQHSPEYRAAVDDRDYGHIQDPDA